jgi:hypothetical protein
MTNPVQIICYLYKSVNAVKICFDVWRRSARLLSFKVNIKQRMNKYILHIYTIMKRKFKQW